MSRKRISFHASRIKNYVLRYRFLAAALAIAFAAALPLLAGPGLLNTRGGGDSPFLLQRVQQLETAVLSGHFPARWMPDANYGYGYPFFNYYAPLSIYTALLFRIIGFSYVGSIQLSQLAGFLVSAGGMFHLARRWFNSEWAGLLASAAYTIAPFHMVNVYTRGDSLAEFWAMAFYPLAVLAVDGVARGKSTSWQVSKRQVAMLALAYAGLILSHNISAMIFSPFLLLYIFLRLPKRSFTIHNSQFIIHYSAALLLAFALAAWFFIPALAEQSLAQLGPVTEGYFHFSNHFRGTNLIQGNFFFDYNPDGGVAFKMGLAQAVTAVLGMLVWLRKGRGERPFLFTAATFFIATFMITPLSRPLWDHLPLLSFTQFPWRFLSVQAFAGALAAGGLALPSIRKRVVTGTAVLLLAAGLGRLPTDYLTLTDADVTAEKLAQYEWFSGNIGTTISAEYLPPTVQPRPTTSAWLTTGERDTVLTLSGKLLTAQRLNDRLTHQIWEVETAVSSTLIFPTMHWPGWVGALDREQIEIRPSPGSGLIMLNVPPGKHIVTLQLKRTPIRLAAEWVSLTAFLLTLWLLKPARFRKPRRSHALTLIAFAAVTILLHRRPISALPPNDLTWDFAQMGYLHHDDTVRFDDGNVLASYAYSHDVISPGETLTITLNWQTSSATEAELALTTPAKSRFPLAPLLAQESQPVAAGPALYQFTIPDDAPPGLFVPLLKLEDGRPLLPSGKTRGELYLRPFRVIQSSIINHQSSTLDARAGQATRQDNTLTLHLAWFTPQPLSRNYNVSLRLLDAAGAVLSQFDAQPGYGYLPSGGWPTGDWVHDWLSLPLPESLPGNAPYAVTAHLYAVDTGEIVLTRRLGELDDLLVFQAQTPVFELPNDMIGGETAVFANDAGPLIQLMGYSSAENNLTLYWQALTATPTNYTRFVHLVNPTNGDILAQVDGYPLGNSYPTSQWSPNEIITYTVRLPAAPGEYEIMIGFYENLGSRWPRLTAVAPNGAIFPDNRVKIDD